jgi:prepilin signal peptidase PulO-like enzyme (type II secretory pathway)
MGVMGSLAIAMVWYRNDAGWQGLLTALVGMSVGGGLIWAVRIVGAAVMRREAMGFGDVTLMAMIGAFVGWQPSLIIFFLAPLAGIFLGILRMILFRDREIPYGPFLCLASLFLIVEWDALWENTQVLFEIGWFMPVVMAVCLVLMGAMLGLWRLIVGLFR